MPIHIPIHMPSSIDIHAASLSDIPALCGLLGTLFTQEAEFHPDATAQERGLAAILADANVGIIYTANIDGRIVGMVTLLFTISTALGARVALLEDLVVAEDCRAAGIGSKLLQHAIEEARILGMKRITLLTDGPNLAAQRFYERHGFNRSHMTPFRLAIGR